MHGQEHMKTLSLSFLVSALVLGLLPSLFTLLLHIKVFIVLTVLTVRINLYWTLKSTHMVQQAGLCVL